MPLRIGNSATKAGSFVFLRGVAAASRSPLDCHIRISRCFDMPQDDLDDVFIHEMIHLYIWINGIEDTGPHGIRFREMMERINSTGGRHLTVKYELSPDVRESDMRQRHHYICITTFSDGTRGLTLCARTRIFEIYRKFQMWPGLLRMEWYWSADPWWNRFRNSLTAKAYRFVEDEIVPHLAQATPCECDGRIFRPRR